MSKEFKDGYEYANRQLKLGVTPKELEIQIDDSFDFNDFVSGMIARWREQGKNTISLRDHFAGLAMQGFLAADYNDWDYEKLALTSYEQADAMLEERSKRDV